MVRLLVTIVVFLVTAAPGFAQTSSPKPSAPTADKKAELVSAEQEEVAALKADLQRLQTNVYQMRANLAFVGNTTTPLYHEFELDIDMWQTMIAQMQRRVERLEKEHQKQKD